MDFLLQSERRLFKKEKIEKMEIEEDQELMPAPLTTVVFRSKAQKKKKKSSSEVWNPRNDPEWSVAFAFLSPIGRETFMTNKCQELKGFACQYCRIQTESFEAFKVHLTLFHEVNFGFYRCWDCKNLYHRVNHLLSHVFYNHLRKFLSYLYDLDLSDVNKARKFEKIPLKFRFTSFVAVKRTEKFGNNPDYVCPFCLEHFRSFFRMKQHIMRNSYAKGHESSQQWFSGWKFQLK